MKIVISEIWSLALEPVRKNLRFTAISPLTPKVRAIWKILWKRGMENIVENIYYLFLDFHVKTGTRFLLRDKRLFEINVVEITRVDCNYFENV